MPGGEGAAVALHRGRNVTIRNCKAAPETGTFLAHSGLSGTLLLTGNDLAHAERLMHPEQSAFTLHGNLLPDGPTEATG